MHRNPLRCFQKVSILAKPASRRFGGKRHDLETNAVFAHLALGEAGQDRSDRCGNRCW